MASETKTKENKRGNQYDDDDDHHLTDQKAWPKRLNEVIRRARGQPSDILFY